MGLIKSKGNMYPWITHQWNPIKGKCYHDCSYCYMKKWGEQPPIYLDEKEFKTDLGENNFIFVCSGCDLFAMDIEASWIREVLNYCKKYDNKYLFQTKNPISVDAFNLPKYSIICTTIETNRWYPEIMGKAPSPLTRVIGMKYLYFSKYITIEPILNFDTNLFVKCIKDCNPIQVNIGADSKGHNLPEPPKEKISELISELEKFTIVKQKSNLKRLL